MHDEGLDEVAELRRQLDDTQHRLAALQERLTSRRNMLRLGGAAAVGVAAAIVGTPGSAAATVGDMRFGEVNSSGSDETELRSSSQLFGLRVTTSSEFGTGLQARNTGGGPAFNALVDPASNSARAVIASVNGDNGYALTVVGGKAQIYISQGFNAGPAVSKIHDAGELAVDDDALWFCVADGNPGTWRKLASVDSAGSFHPIPTARVYDSRWNNILFNVIKGPIVVGAGSRLVYCDAKRALDTGLPIQQDVVPPGATAIAYNLTVTRTTGQGYLSVEPGGTVEPGGSAINWSPGLASIANASVVKLDSQRRISVFIGGPAATSTHFIIDVVGYYR